MSQSRKEKEELKMTDESESFELRKALYEAFNPEGQPIVNSKEVRSDAQFKRP